MSDKLKKWSVLSYVAAVLHAIVLVLLVIEWVAWKADAFRLISNFIWRFLTTNSAAWFHTAMALFVIVFGGGIVVLFCEAKMKIISVLINIFPVDLDDLENRCNY